MTTADYALIISLFSAVLSLAGFIWNVWSKFIYPKPRLRVRFNRMHTLDYRGKPVHPVLVLTATNLGPGPVTLFYAIVCKRWRWQRDEIGILNPMNGPPPGGNPSLPLGPFAGGLPKKIDTGEEFALYFPGDAEWDTPERIARHERIGFQDTFGRKHLTIMRPKGWIPAATLLTRVRRRLRKNRDAPAG